MSSTSIGSAIAQLKLQTRLFENVLTGLDDDRAHEPLVEGTNPPIWIAGHIVSTRITLCAFLGIPIEEPFPKLFSRGKSYDAELDYPSVVDITKGWFEASEKLIAKLSELSEAELQYDAPIKTPIDGADLGSFIAFITQHESYHIGQLGLYRKQYGLPGMSYA